MELGSITILGYLDYVMEYFYDHFCPEYELRSDVSDYARTPYMLQLDCVNRVAYMFRIGTSNPMDFLNKYQKKAVEDTTDLGLDIILYSPNGVHYHKLVFLSDMRKRLVHNK